MHLMAQGVLESHVIRIVLFHFSFPHAPPSSTLSSTTWSPCNTTCAPPRKGEQQTPTTSTPRSQVMGPTTWSSASSATPRVPSPTLLRHRTWTRWHYAQQAAHRGTQRTCQSPQSGRRVSQSVVIVCRVQRPSWPTYRMAILAFISKFVVVVRIRMELEVSSTKMFAPISLFCPQLDSFTVDSDPLEPTEGCEQNTLTPRIFSHICTHFILVHMHRMGHGVAARVSLKKKHVPPHVTMCLIVRCLSSRWPFPLSGASTCSPLSTCSLSCTSTSTMSNPPRIKPSAHPHNLEYCTVADTQPYHKLWAQPARTTPTTQRLMQWSSRMNPSI